MTGLRVQGREGGGGLVYGSVCSGIEAASVAWDPLGWRAAFVSEIEPAPRAVLAYRFPETPLHGDFTTIQAGSYAPINVLVGGTPCQSFSVAGLRGGLDDERGNLALEFLRLAHRLRPRWLVWENVPGVLSSAGGRDFGAILGGMVELGYGFAYRVLDAQHVRIDGFGRAVPQRRRRVFVVGYLGDWRRVAAVLFERACLSGDPPPRREAGQGAARPLASCAPGGSGYRNDADTAENLIAFAAKDSSVNASFGVSPTMQAAADRGHGAGLAIAFGGKDTRGPIQVATAVNAHGGPHGRLHFESETFIAFNSREDPEVTWDRAGPLGASSPQSQAIAFDTTQITSATNRCRPEPGDPCHPLAAGAHPPAVALSVSLRGREGGGSIELGDECAMALRASQGGGDKPHALIGHNGGPPMQWAVWRLLPVECERLQGFPDGWTLVPWRGGLMPDGPRYKMLGNSMAVNVMRWLGRRIEMVEAIPVPLMEAA